VISLLLTPYSLLLTFYCLLLFIFAFLFRLDEHNISTDGLRNLIEFLFADVLNIQFEIHAAHADNPKPWFLFAFFNFSPFPYKNFPSHAILLSINTTGIEFKNIYSIINYISDTDIYQYENMASKKKQHPGEGKQERFIQPSILMSLFLSSSYGYEIIKTIQQFGFIEGQAPPGMIYRHLRQLEEDGLVASEWKTEGSGPAKRMYRLTLEGKEVLEIWIDYISQQIQKLTAFVERYQKATKKA